MGTIDARIIALDARSGSPCADFGIRGEIRLSTGKLEWPGELQITSAAAESYPLVVLMPHDHALAARSSIRSQDIAGETLIGVSPVRAPTLWSAINDYVKRVGLAVKPDHQAENIAMAFSLIASTGGISLLPLYAQNLLPKTLVSRPIQGAPPMVDLVIGYSEANSSPLLKFLVSKVDELKFRVAKSSG